ncbi:MAG: nucleotidyl transferase AbiEii/AbiGii toxin family protein [Pseudomonadota bacterium]|nr:nucleotidyl transferase AbiEii/AbiGii toxin family protein [Pseudomonadota bacterium]
MISIAYITQWRSIAPWADDIQVEQDLILSRVLVEIYSDPFLRNELAFRGGTALNKLFITPASRYSEDIDLVRTGNGPISEIADALRARLEPWLGVARRNRTNRSFKLEFHFNPETASLSKQRVKIEVNIQETFSIAERISKSFSVKSDWFSGEAQINTFQLEEILATKLRALYQRSKGRDLFDLWLAINQLECNIDNIIHIFLEYMKREGAIITRKLFEQNLELKLRDNVFVNDLGPLLSPNIKWAQTISSDNDQDEPAIVWNLVDAAETIKHYILNHLHD